MKHLFIAVILLAGSVSFVSCGDKSSANTEVTPADTSKITSAPNPNYATLTEEQIKSIGIELGIIEEKQLTASLKTNGVLRVPNQNKASVNSIYSGVIKSILVEPGNTVRKGQAIATVANPAFIQVQSQYLNVNAKISMAQLEVTRQQELNAGNAGALKNLQAAETELNTLHTLKSTLQQQIQLMGVNPANISNGKLVSVLTITSPIAGVVSNVLVKLGTYVDVTTAVAEIVDNSQLHLDLFVFEKDLPKLQDHQIIHFTVTNNPGKEYDAQIFSLGSSFEGDSKAITVHATVKSLKTGLIDGMNVTAAVSLNKATVPAVPNDALVTVAGQDYIFVFIEQKDKTMRFERVAVSKGTSDVGYTEITLLKEIPKNASIVVKGAFFVSAKMTNVEED
ncbi:MAG: efflux RND transporter periplasmic adaptor subunit [Chitinophagaceae bacterium]